MGINNDCLKPNEMGSKGQDRFRLQLDKDHSSLYFQTLVLIDEEAAMILIKC